MVSAVTPRGAHGHKMRQQNNVTWRVTRARRKSQKAIIEDRDTELAAIEKHLAQKGATKIETVRREYGDPMRSPGERKPQPMPGWRG